MSGILVKMDDRESGELYKRLMEIGVICYPERLKVGDYVVDDLGLCIEFKTIDDLCGSIMDGRVEKQCERMLKHYKHNFVIVSGNISNRVTNIHRNCVLGMIVKLELMGMNVLMLEDDSHCAFVIKRIIDRLYDATLLEENRIYNDKEVIENEI